MNELCAWDLDGTIRPGHLLADVVSFCGAAGYLDLALFENPDDPTREELPHFLDAIANRSQSDFKELIEKIEDEARTSAYPFALERLEYQAEHSHPVIFSLSPAFMVKAFARGLGTVRHARGTYFHTQSNVFSGHRKTLEKVTAVRRYQREKSLPVLSFAAGDTVHDLGVLNRAESCLVVNPGEELTEIAESKNWEIIRT